jgi:hypothetical protein
VTGTDDEDGNESGVIFRAEISDKIGEHSMKQLVDVERFGF